MRRSTRIRDSKAEQTTTPVTHARVTRRQSLLNNPLSTTPQLNKTPANNLQKKLTNHDISHRLNEISDDEVEYDQYKSNAIYEASMVEGKECNIKLVRLKNSDLDKSKESHEFKEKSKIEEKLTKQSNQQNNVKKAMRKRSASPKSSHSEVDNTPKNLRPTRHRSLKNLNENTLIHEQLIQNEVTKSAQSNKSKDVARTPRKRTASQTNYRYKDDSYEVDENSIPNVNKCKNDLMKTPSNTRSRTPAKNLRGSVKKLMFSQKENANITLTPQNGILKTKESNRRSYYRETKEKGKNLNGYSDFSESGDDDNDNTMNEEDCESESNSEFFDDDDDDDEFFPKSKNKQNNFKKNKTITKVPKTPSKTPKKVSMETPTKSMAKMCLTPSMHQRTANIMKPSTPLQEARLKLHVSVLPKSLPCREEQFNDIYTFLHARLSDASGGCMYISGVPGTGKTATVSEVIRCLEKSRDAGKLTQFKFIDINGMKLSEPRQAYVQIWKQLSGKQTTWEEAHKLLQERFVKSKFNKGITLLLVDELDLLCTKRQDVVYNLLDWPTKSGAKLIVVTIANTMDLPERVLMGKVTSRLGLCRLTFPPYNYKQLEEIVASRLRGYNTFGGEAIELVARKVAAVSGDARRALDICRRATEIAENKNEEIVSIMDVKQAVDEMIASPKIQAIKHCSEMERLFLQAVCTEVHRLGVEEVVFKNVYIQLTSLCIFNGEQAPNVTESLAMCARLSAWRLLLCDHSRMDIHQRILLNVSTDDVQFAIKTLEG